ncbi:MAG: hypothetical protein QF704_14155, partial [Anaerolineales bacterium]|nr:hypothetical protein [Anaerolineales bacterium]
MIIVAPSSARIVGITSCLVCSRPGHFQNQDKRLSCDSRTTIHPINAACISAALPMVIHMH